MKITDEMVEMGMDALRDVEPGDDEAALRAFFPVIAPLIRSAALEEAARLADDKEDGLVNHAKRFPTNPDIAHEYLVRAADASDIAAAIRALKDKPHE